MIKLDHEDRPDLNHVLGEDGVDVGRPVVDERRDVLEILERHRVVQLGRVPPLLPRHRGVGQPDLEHQRLLELIGSLFRSRPQ